MSDSEEVSSEQAIEISIKKPQGQKKPKEKKKIIKQKPKAKPKISEGLRSLLEQKIQDENILKQLQSKPFDFQKKQSKVVKISDSTQKIKKLTGLGISLVQLMKKEKRATRDRVGQLMRGCSNLRKSFENIKNLKKK